MPGWELHDGGKAMGPMSEEAVLWAIKRGLPSSTRVRPEGQEEWIALDDHGPFAEELVSRDNARKQRPRRGKRTGYTWQEVARVLVAPLGVVLVVVGYEWVKTNGDPYIRAIEGFFRARAAETAAALPAGSSAEPDPGAVKQAEDAASVASLSARERARMATSLLEPASADLREGVCKAHAYLDPLSEPDKKKPEVARALSLLSSKELPLLRAEQAEFEKTRGVLCGDGTKPKDCPCQGAHESCCVLHKGVARCEPLPTKIRCP